MGPELSLDFDGAADGVHGARELYQRTIPHELDDTTGMGGAWTKVTRRSSMLIGSRFIGL